jgi:hypothetical protein
MTFASKLIFFLICFSLVAGTMLYGTVHQPTIAFFYIQVALMLLLWAYESFRSGELRVSRHLLQIPLYATSIYGFIQTIPFGTYTDASGLANIPRTISAAPFETQLTSLHFLGARPVFLSAAHAFQYCRTAPANGERNRDLRFRLRVLRDPAIVS